ncbi:MAG TPA: hypothetical protein VFG59_14580 [Anaeromyxobacter sp.]|nr:hypothetical protein [Anaeromyxobacter sp.]
MSAPTRTFLEAAQAGQPVYLSHVRRTFSALPPAASVPVTCTLCGADGALRTFVLRLPRLSSLPTAERALATEYFLASVYNIISTLGGSELRVSAEGDPPEAGELAAAVARAFGVERPRRDRPGYGRALNVAERMNQAVPGGGAAAAFRCAAVPHRTSPVQPGPPAAGGGVLAVCREAVAGLEERTLCGIDVGGTDIKLALAVRGKVTRFVEYDWFPASFTAIDELVRPIVLLARLLRLEAIRTLDETAAAALGEALEPAMAGGTDHLQRIEAAVEAGERRCPEHPFRFDALGLCFPDVVVHDKIVGGEVYKTRGIRQNAAIDYEREFRKLSHLDEALRALVRPGGVVGIVNDGPMAAFTAAVETAAAHPSAVERGVFAHTLGTELGTGWVTEEGEIPDIPLEVYNCVIDLGSYPERAFEPDDVRSVNNFNTRIPGTLQKYASQSGVFRLAAKHLPAADPTLFRDLFARGLLVEDGPALWVPTEPKDMRKPLLEHLMRLAGGGHPAVDRIFREVGEFLAVAWLETEFLLAPRARERILFGRLVKHRPCFALMVEGARHLAPELTLGVADEELANTPYMKALKERPGYTVAQFAQAIGALHYANHRLVRAERRKMG